MELIIIWVVSIFVGAMIGANKGQDVSGMFWPLFLGPIGVIIVLALPNKVKLEAESAQMRLREEELRVQKEILRELKASRAQAQEAPPVVFSPTPPASPNASECLEDFIPESLQSTRRMRR